MPIKTGTFQYSLIVALIALGVGWSSPVFAFQTSQARQNPAPWRPSFGSINRSAIETQNGASASNQQIDLSNNRQSAASEAPRIAPPSNSNTNTGSATQTNNPPSTTGRSTRVASLNGPGVTRVTKTMDKLPNSAGQIWREYDISPYTSQVTTSKEPQKAITEWILRETGTEMWFAEPLGILHASKNQLLVYHTPEIHNVVKKIVDRFVRTRGQVQNMDVNLVTVEKPNWREQSYTMLQPIEVRSPGVEAWMISKENAAILLSQLSQRGDFKQHSGGRLTNHDGQSLVLEKTKPVQFVRSLRWVPNQVPSYQPLITSLDEGYRLSISSLSSLDGNSIEAVVKCDVDQVEKLTTVKVNVPGAGGASQNMDLKIPQMVSWRLHERFRWPNDQVLLLSCGVVATPDPNSGGGLRLLAPKTRRADALLFIEYRGPAAGQLTQNQLGPLATRR